MQLKQDSSKMINIQVLEEKGNPLFNRKEVKVIVESKSNPSLSEAEKGISEKFSQPKENIKINKIQGKFGRNTFLIIANVYTSLGDKDKTEPKPKVKKEKK